MSFSMGAYSYTAPILRGNHNNVTIGKYSSIAQGVIIDCGFSHNIKNVSTYPFNPNMTGCGHLPLNLKIKGDVTIGHDVYIGEDAIIMSNVNIGHGAVIGIRSIITKDIEPYSIVVGANRVVGKRFTDEQIKRLLEICWWDWPDERVRQNANLLLSEDIDNFINNHV